MDFAQANSADPDEMPHSFISPGSSLFAKVSFYSFPIYQGLISTEKSLDFKRLLCQLKLNVVILIGIASLIKMVT